MNGPRVEKVKDSRFSRVQFRWAALGDLSSDEEGSRFLQVGEGETVCVQRVVRSSRRGRGLLWVLESIKVRHRLHRVCTSACTSPLVISLGVLVPVVVVVVPARGVLSVPLGGPLIVGVVRFPVVSDVLALRLAQHRLLRGAGRTVAGDRSELLQQVLHLPVAGWRIAGPGLCGHISHLAERLGTTLRKHLVWISVCVQTGVFRLPVLAQFPIHRYSFPFQWSSMFQLSTLLANPQ